MRDEGNYINEEMYYSKLDTSGSLNLKLIYSTNEYSIIAKKKYTENYISSTLTELFDEYGGCSKGVRKKEFSDVYNQESIEAILHHSADLKKRPAVASTESTQSIPQLSQEELERKVELERVRDLKRQKELERREKARIFAEKRGSLTQKLGFSVPNDISDDEFTRLSDDEVVPLAAEWYFFLKRNNVSVAFPDSMNGEFSAVIDVSARDFVSERTGIATGLPLDRLLEVSTLSLTDQAFGRVVGIAEHPLPDKNFPLGKVYESVPISGLRERTNPLEATALLVYGLIGTKEKKVAAAYKVFEKGKLDTARAELRASRLTREKVFGAIAHDLELVSQGDDTAAKHILSYFLNEFPSEEVSDLVQGVKGLFEHSNIFTHLDIKMQDGVYRDLFDNSQVMSCTFLPSGMYMEATIGYHADPDVGLLHAVPRQFDASQDPIGVSILLNAYDDAGNKWLVVDSVEGGRDLERVRKKLWMPAVMRSVVAVGRDVNAYKIFVNGSVHNGRPKTFVKYVEERAEPATVNLIKAGVTDYTSLGVASNAHREAFETWGENGRAGEAKGFVLEVPQ